VLRADVGRTPGLEVLATPARGREVAGRLESLAGVGGGQAAEEAEAVLRVREGIPAWGAEITPDVTPLEARLGDVAIAWGKGCYPGQEPVAMARHRGRPPNLLVRLAVAAGARPAPGTPLAEGDEAVGRLTTVVADPDEEDPDAGPFRALAYVRTPRAEAGRVFALPGGGRARVLGWPAEREA
jgi:folate-binding protein YgfZ